MRFVFGWRERPNPKIQIEPMMEHELSRILFEKEKIMRSAICFPDKSLIWGPPLEIGVVETFKIQNLDFTMTEALWQVAIPKESS